MAEERVHWRLSGHAEIDVLFRFHPSDRHSRFGSQ
jgi:hypothetical protein